MANIYESFLRSPSAAALTSNASLHYITTTTSIHGSTAIIKHLQAQEKIIKKKTEIILSSIASSDGVAIETDTTFEFVRGGGALMPNMDDNFLVDSIATVPVVHFVSFDSQGKIHQIRLHWDQSTMLKQVEAIGKSGRNWPIRDGQTMTKLVRDSVSGVNSGEATPDSFAPTKTQNVSITNRSTSSRDRDDKNFNTRLFATGDDDEPRPVSRDPAVAVRTSAKPAPRQWAEIFPNGPSTDKIEGLRPKSGSSKNFVQNRLFDKAQTDDQSESPERRKGGPTKHDHFEFGNGEEAEPRDGSRPTSAKAKKHTSNWDFEDFVTPPKSRTTKHQPEHERHFGAGIDEDEPSPVKRPIVHAPRRDADAHFDMTDAPTPDANRHQPKVTRPDALGTHLKSENGVLTADEKQPLANITNSHIRRGQDQYNHYTSTDASPGVSIDENAPVDDTRQHGRNTKSKSRTENDQAHWGNEETPQKATKIYKTAGDGMGGRKNTDRSWMIGEEQSVGPEKKIYKTFGNGMGGRSDATPTWSLGDRDEEVEAHHSGERKIYKTSGDGTGSHPSPSKFLSERRMSSPRKRPREISGTVESALVSGQRDGFESGVEKRMMLQTCVLSEKGTGKKAVRFVLDDGDDSF